MKKKPELLMAIIDKASEDEDFRERLLSDANSAISSEFDVALPDGINIVLHENDANTVHLPVPPPPKVLSEGQLSQVNAGNCVGCACI